tara:strand:+ start:817 stop:1719 length:903 start_codon:yes stop_codon:yes gene_type:complete
MTHGSLFSGIGGFDLASKWMGWENVFHCEYDPFCQKVLKHHFPNSKLYEDVRTFDATDYAGRIDLLSGGFPCQPFSNAGLRKGTEDDRHLWPQMLRIIREISPRYVVGENVRGLLNWSGGLVFEEVCSDLEAEGYEVTPYLLPACGKDAPHRRDRIWFIAHSNDSYDGRTPRQNESESKEERLQERNKIQQLSQSSKVFGNAPDTDIELSKCGNDNREDGRSEQTERTKSFGKPRGWEEFPTQPPICGRDDGFPEGLDGITVSRWRNQSLKSYGNAIVPQVAHEIFKAIQKMEDLDNKPN